MPGYQGKPMMSPRHGSTGMTPADASLVAIMGDSRGGRGGGGPLSPRHDKPQENVHPTPLKRSKSSSKHHHKSRKNKPSFDEMDEASKEAHIVQKIEMAIKKSRSERKASIRSHSAKRQSIGSSSESPIPHPPRRQPKDETEFDENYQIIKSGDNHRSKPKRAPSNKSKVHRHKPKPALEAPRLEHTKHNSILANFNNENDLSDIDGLVDDKRGFQVHVDGDQWLSTNFSDPTLDTFEQKHFSGEDGRALGAMLNPQRIHCGPGRSATDSSKSGKEPDAVTSIIDRIYQKNEQTGNTYTRKQKAEPPKSKKRTPHQPGNGNGNTANNKNGPAKEEPATELMSFDNYEDDDGYYYEDDEDDYPIYPSSKPPPPRPATTEIPISMNMPSLIGFGSAGNKEGASSNDALQTQLDEINQLHRDIQRQQDMIKQFSQISARDSTQNVARLNPHETSADVYHRELARQAQAELYRMELVQKSVMLEKQMEVYRRNQEEWNKVRDLAIKEEENRRKIVEKAKEVWQAEMRTNFAEDEDRKVVVGQGGGGLSAIEEMKSEEASSNHQPSSEGSSSGEHPTLYHKIAELNKRTVLTEEDQKMIEAEILRELHIELSKQAAQKKVMQKPLFYSERMRSSWSGKQTFTNDDPHKSIEQITDELTRQIQALNLEMAPSKNSSTKRGGLRRSKDEASEESRLPKMKLGLFRSRTKDAKTPPRVPHGSRDQEANYDEHVDDDREEERVKVKFGRIRSRTKDSRPPPKIAYQSHDAPVDEMLDHGSIDNSDEENAKPKNERVRSKATATKSQPAKISRRDKEHAHDSDDEWGEEQAEAEEDYSPDFHTKKKKKALFRRLRKKIMTKATGTMAALSAAQAETTTRKKQAKPAQAEIVPRKLSRRALHHDLDEEEYSSCPSDDDDVEPKDVEEYFLRQGSSISSPRNPPLESGPSHKKHGRVPSATSSQSTQWTSNKIYIGIEGDAIEAMSFNSKNVPFSPVSKDLSCESHDRYTTCSKEEVVVASAKNPPVSAHSIQISASKDKPAKCKAEDDASIFEFLEVQYYPHDEVEAPLDEIEADTHGRRPSF